MFFFPPFLLLAVHKHRLKRLSTHSRKCSCLKNEWKENNFLSFVYVSCLFFFGIPRVISLKLTFFTVEWSTMFAWINIWHKLSSHTILWPQNKLHTLNYQAEIQFSNFLCHNCSQINGDSIPRKLISFIRIHLPHKMYEISPKSLSLHKMNFEFFGSDEFCRSSNTTLEHHPLSKY